MKAPLTFAEACSTAKSMEAAGSNAKAISGAGASGSSVHRVVRSCMKGSTNPQGDPPQKQQPCYHCGRKNHKPANCKYIDATCHSCGKKLQFVALAQSRLQESSRFQGRSQAKL